MSNLYQTKQPGDILRLPLDIERPDAPIFAGGYVLLSVGDVCCVAGLVLPYGWTPGGRRAGTVLHEQPDAIPAAGRPVLFSDDGDAGRPGGVKDRNCLSDNVG